MSVKSYALTTRQRLKDFAGITANTDTVNNVLDRLIDSTTEFIHNYIGFQVQEKVYTQEIYDTQMSDTLILKAYPISTSATFTLQRRDNSLNEDDWETIDTQYYFIDYEAGIVQGAAGWKFFRGKQGYRVTYTAGYSFDNTTTFLSDTTAGDLEWAAWQLATAAYNMRSGGAGIVKESIGDYSVQYAKNVFENDDIKSILDKYARNEPGGTLTPLHY